MSYGYTVTSVSCWTFSIFNLSLKGGHTTIAPHCSAAHIGINSTNEWVPAQKGRKWCGMQPGTLTLWYAISLCSPVHDAIQVPQFYNDFCFLQSHKILVFPPPKIQNRFVFVTISWYLSYFYSSLFIPRLWLMWGQILLFRFSFLYI